MPSRLPNFLVVGAQRCGTTLLHSILVHHPEIALPFERKEIHYFDRYYDRGPDWYAGFFEEDRPAIGEVTPDYLFEPDVPARIKKLIPDCRIIAILRDPVDRAWSGYCHIVRTKREMRDFAVLVKEDHDLVRRGLYGEQLQRYVDLFDKIWVMTLADLQGFPAVELHKLRQFLKLDAPWPGLPAEYVQRRVNPAPPPRFGRAFVLARRAGAWLSRHDLDAPVRWAKQVGLPKLFGEKRQRFVMPPEVEPVLIKRYRADTAQLEAMLKRRFFWRSSPPE